MIKNVQQVIYVHGMKRSGNHAVLNWMLPQLQPYRFHNNLIPVRQVLLGHKKMLDPVPFAEWLQDDYKKQGISRAELATTPFNAIASLEDLSLQTNPFTDTPKPPFHILILREPENLFASRIRKGFVRKETRPHPAYPTKMNEHLKRIVQTWKEHAQESLGIQNKLPNKFIILFDEFIQSEEYRKQISEQFGWQHSDAGLEEVKPTGGGSSFHGTEYDGRASQMDVSDRKKYLESAESALLEEIMSDSEMQQLATEIRQQIS